MLLRIFFSFLLLAATSKQDVEPHIKNGQHNSDFDKDILLHDADAESTFDDAVLKLPVSEQKERLKDLVMKKIDENQDGFVDEPELQKWSLKAFNDYETEETREDFPFIDADKDGFISWEEYSLESFGSDFSEDSEDFKNPVSEEWKNFVEMYEREKRLFKVADADKNSQLTFEEYRNFKHPKFNGETKKVLILETLEKTDLDKDGKISLGEYLGDYKKDANDEDPEWIATETNKFYEEFDKNKDKVLDENEMVDWVATDNEELAREEAKHLISECDLNGDSKLTVDEIIGNHELWIDSDATDYGKYLLKKHDEF